VKELGRISRVVT